MSTCPCGSGAVYSACCEAFLTGAALPPTAEALMRSRFSAFAIGETDYLFATTHPEMLKGVDRDGTQRWAEARDWQRLEILATEAGGEADDEGMVEFVAHFRYKDVPQRHHEVSRFARVDGRWYFHSGRPPEIATYRAESRVGRNDPCPCGSGRKFKKCCGA